MKDIVTGNETSKNSGDFVLLKRAGLGLIMGVCAVGSAVSAQEPPDSPDNLLPGLMAVEITPNVNHEFSNDPGDPDAFLPQTDMLSDNSADLPEGESLNGVQPGVVVGNIDAIRHALSNAAWSIHTNGLVRVIVIFRPPVEEVENTVVAMLDRASEVVSVLSDTDSQAVMIDLNIGYMVASIDQVGLDLLLSADAAIASVELDGGT